MLILIYCLSVDSMNRFNTMPNKFELCIKLKINSKINSKILIISPY